jgi:hypothetical protein
MENKVKAPAKKDEPEAAEATPKEFALNADDLEGDRFEGKIAKASLQNTDYGEKIVLEVEVPFFEDTMKIRMAPSTRKKSKWGIFLAGLKECGVKLKALEDLEGAKFEFERRDFQMGKGLNPIEGFPVPIKFVGQEK